MFARLIASLFAVNGKESDERFFMPRLVEESDNPEDWLPSEGREFLASLNNGNHTNTGHSTEGEHE